MNPLEELKVSQLKAELKDRGADSRGSKSVLMIRLKELLDDEGVDVESFVAARRDGGSRADRNPNGVQDETDHDKDSLPPAPGTLTRAGSQASLRSSASQASVSSLRAVESATKAGLLARAAFLKEKQKLDMDEMTMKRRAEEMRRRAEEREVEMRRQEEEREMQMKMRREELQLQTELAESEARERVLIEAEGSLNPGVMNVSQGYFTSMERLPQPIRRTACGEQVASGLEQSQSRLQFEYAQDSSAQRVGVERGCQSGTAQASFEPERQTQQLDATQVIVS